MPKEHKMNETVYFKCNKCDKIVYQPTGAITHGVRLHKLNIKLKNIEKYFSIVKNPPAEIVETIEKKRSYQRKYHVNLKNNKKNNLLPVVVPPVTDGEIHYKCNECGVVLRKRNSMYSHCSKNHDKSFAHVGCTETTEPLSNPTRYSRKQNPVPNMMGHMPQVLDVIKAEIIENEVVLTVRIKIPTSYVATYIVPTSIANV